MINTAYCDRMPFLHPDMKTLYFSSDGHGGLGKMDVFKSTRLNDNCWDCWSEPINLGIEINTIDWAKGLYMVMVETSMGLVCRQLIVE